jgi:SHS2 domain-containing protein
MYETFEHTADLGLRIRAPDKDTLFAEAGLCLFSTIVEDLSAIRPEMMVEIALSGEEIDYLLFDWLRELLYRFDAEHWLFSRFEVDVGGKGSTAKAWGEKFDAERHGLGHEVKAITYHGLSVEETADGWLAEVIVDI